jgi:elongation factor G
MRVAIEPKATADQDKLAQALERLALEDPSFQVLTDRETGQTLIAGMGELHLEVLVRRLADDFNVKANVGKMRVAYRETVTGSAEVEHTFERPSATGKGQFGHCRLRVSPASRGEGLRFLSRLPAEGGREGGREGVREGGREGGRGTKGGRAQKQPKEARDAAPAFPEALAQAIRASVESIYSSGCIAGYPMVDLTVEVLEARLHETDSTEAAYQVAAAMALREACNAAAPTLLEPFMSLEVILPEGEDMGNIIGDINSRRGEISGVTFRGNSQVVTALVPLEQMMGYATKMRTMTHGRGRYTMTFDRYAPVSSEMAKMLMGF